MLRKPHSEGDIALIRRMTKLNICSALGVKEVKNGTSLNAKHGRNGRRGLKNRAYALHGWSLIQAYNFLIWTDEIIKTRVPEEKI